MACSVHVARAQNSNGTGGGDWNAATTWQGGVVPTTSSQVNIQSGDTVIVSDSEAFNSMSVNGILTINSTGTLTMSGAGVVSVNGTINNSGILVNSVSSGSAFAGSGTFNNLAGATVDFTADTFFPSQFQYIGWPNTFNFAANSTVEFGGTSTCNGEYDLAFPCNVLVAGGTLSSGSPLFFDGNLAYNSGTLNFSGGTETFAGTNNQSISGTSEPAFNTLVVDNTGSSPGNTVYEYSGTQATTTLTAGNLDVAAVASGANNAGAISVASGATLTITNAVANGYVSGTTLTGGASASGLVFDFTGVNPSTTAASLELSGAISGFTSADGSTITILGTGIPTGTSVYQLASFATSTAPSFSTVNSPSGLTCTITTSATGITMTVAAASVGPPAPIITSCSQSGGQISITYSTTPTYSYHLVSSSTLTNSSTNWSAVSGSTASSVTGTSETYTFPNPESGNMFYRVVSP